MPTRVVVYATVIAGIALFTPGCDGQPAAPPMRAAPSKPSLGASTPFNNGGQCLGNDADTWSQFVALHDSQPLNCTADDIAVTSMVATLISFDGITFIPLTPGSSISC